MTDEPEEDPAVRIGAKPESEPGRTPLVGGRTPLVTYVGGDTPWRWEGSYRNRGTVDVDHATAVELVKDYYAKDPDSIRASAAENLRKLETLERLRLTLDKEWAEREWCSTSQTSPKNAEEERRQSLAAARQGVRGEMLMRLLLAEAMRWVVPVWSRIRALPELTFDQAVERAELLMEIDDTGDAD